MKHIINSIALCLLATTAAQAQAKAPKKPDFKLVEAYTQRIITTPEAPPPTGEHFVIIWQSDVTAKTFYWRGKNGFMMCMVQKAHKIAKKDAKKYPANMAYNLEDPGGIDIKKGDTIEITPVARGKIRIPDDIPQTAKNTIFYQTATSGWLLFPVKKIGKKKDIVNK